MAGRGRPRKILSDDHKKAMQEGRKKLKEKSVNISFKDVTIKSYSYGYIYYFNDNEFNKKYFTDLKILFKSLLNEKLRKKTITSVETMLEEIEKVYKGIEILIKKLN